MVILVHLRELCNYTKYSYNSFFYQKHVHRENQSLVIISGRKKNESSVFGLNLELCQVLTGKFYHFSQSLNLLPFLPLTSSVLSQTC